MGDVSVQQISLPTDLREESLNLYRHFRELAQAVEGVSSAG